MSVDWPKLVNQGRAKAIGVSWTEEEAIALSKCNPIDREAMIVELRSKITPEEIKEQKDTEKADKIIVNEAKKASAKADKEATKTKK